MQVVFFILVITAAFLFMEFVAWWAHKYIMHGLLWHLHEDHHKGGYHPFQKNDWFFIIFALPCMSCFLIGALTHLLWPVAIAFGILLYGFSYFIVHDVIIHQRFKWFSRSNNRYIKAIKWAHKMHHKHLDRHNGEAFGMLVAAKKYWNKVKRDELLSRSNAS